MKSKKYDLSRIYTLDTHALMIPNAHLQYTTETTVTINPDTGASGPNIDAQIGSGGFFPGAGNTTMNVGDSGSDTQDIAIIGFDISGISGTVKSANLRVEQEFVTATIPYAVLGTMVVDHVDAGSTIDVSDFNPTIITSNIGTISTDFTLEIKSLSVSSAVQADVDAGRSSSQFRLRFTTDTNNDSTSQRSHISSADTVSNNQPELVVTFAQ